MRTSTRRAATAALATAAVTCLAAPAAAAPIEQFTFYDEQVQLREDVCGVEGLDVEWRRVEHGHVLLNARGADRLPYATGAFQGSATYTHLESGVDLTFRWRSMDKDLRLTDNGDGTTTAVIQVSGDRSWWSGGRRLSVDTGTMRVEVLVDNGGTPTDPSDDEFLREVADDKPSTGRTDDATFCALFLPLVGAA